MNWELKLSLIVVLFLIGVMPLILDEIEKLRRKK
jgi:hypothetical protein